MNIFATFKSRIDAVIGELAAEGALPAGLDLARVAAEPPREASHGDVTTNAAMVLAKPAGKAPKEIANLLVARLKKVADVTDASVAGPGFINLKLNDEIWRSGLRDVLTTGTSYGDGAPGQHGVINVEYVSANPTGPMHVGHARGAVVGDALARLLAKAGFTVTKEYYINDAGGQVDHVARALRARYLQALGKLSEEDVQGMLQRKEIMYGGDYLVPVAEALKARDGDKWAAATDDKVWIPVLRDFTVAYMMKAVKEDLEALGVHHDVFSSEKALVDAGKVDDALKFLENAGLTYTGVLEPPKGKTPDDWEPRPQLLFKATQFGDEVDRPVKKSDGSWTYFAGDIAYHKDKVDRGFNNLVNIWGADHGGYVKRVQAALKALTAGKGALDVQLCQMVRVLNNGEPVKMSKRAGTFVTLRDLLDEVGKDVVRFIMLTRKNDAPLDFDYAKVMEKSRENPVFYVQYAHARGRSVFRLAKEMFPAADLSDGGLAKADLARLTDPDEIGVLRTIANWPRTVEGAALAHEPHRLAFYMYELASQFHGLWNKGNEETHLRFLQPEDQSVSCARLALVRGVGLVIASGLAVFGVEPVEEMR
ncbi:MAG: arginine--tRNA ligase [Rhodospirillaceae bacterium]|nr:arginine--tRNA ligase [Rhodospirillaceae bacterium]